MDTYNLRQITNPPLSTSFPNKGLLITPTRTGGVVFLEIFDIIMIVILKTVAEEALNYATEEIS